MTMMNKKKTITINQKIVLAEGPSGTPKFGFERMWSEAERTAKL
jgi:hypothetical protein